MLDALCVALGLFGAWMWWTWRAPNLGVLVQVSFLQLWTPNRFLTSGLVHLSLMICGSAKQPFETTFCAYCYTNGAAALLQIIPLCGAYISGNAFAAPSTGASTGRVRSLINSRSFCAIAA